MVNTKEKIEKYKKSIEEIKKTIEQISYLPLHSQEYANQRREYFTLQARYEERIAAIDLMNDINNELTTLFDNYSLLLGSFEDAMNEIKNRE